MRRRCGSATHFGRRIVTESGDGLRIYLSLTMSNEKQPAHVPAAFPRD
jgi:hypothetical protein